MTLLRVLACTVLLLGVRGLSAAEPAESTENTPVSYYRDVRPLFVLHCQGCHQPARPQGGYVMTSHADLLKAGDKGQSPVVAGKPAESYLLEQLVSRDGKAPAMPKNKPPLAEREVNLIRNWIAQGAKDDTPASARQKLVDAEHPPIYALPPVLTALDYSPDGSLLAVSGYHEILLHKADGSGLVGRLVGLAERIESLGFSPDGKFIAMAGGSPGRFGEVQIWDVATKKLKLSVSSTYDTLYGVSWSHDGTKIAFGCADNTVRAIDANTGQQVLFQGAHNDWVLDTCFSSDSKFLISVSRDRSMKLTEVATQRFIDNVTSITPGALKGGLATVARRPFKEKKVVKAANISVSSTEEKIYEELLIGGSDGTPRLYKMHRESKRVIGDDANKVREFEALPGRIFSARFNADGSRFVIGSSLEGKGEARVYQAADGKRISTLEGPVGPVFAVTYRPDGKEVAVAGFEGVVRLHDPETGKLIKQFSPVPLATAGK